MKQSRLEAMKAQALQVQADRVGSMEETVSSLEGKLDKLLRMVTEIHKSLQLKAKGEAKDKDAPEPEEKAAVE